MGRRWYLDASALAKRYATEKGTPLLNHLFNQVPRRDMMCLTLGTLEVISIFVRKMNGGQLSPAAFNQVMTDFRDEILDTPDLGKVSATDALVESTIPLIPKHSLNATDGVILRSALDIHAQLRQGGDSLVLITSNQRLLKAAQAEGLATFDPEAQSQADLDALLASP